MLTNYALLHTTCEGILGILQRRWFDRLRGEDGFQVLSELLECG